MRIICSDGAGVGGKGGEVEQDDAEAAGEVGSDRKGWDGDQ